MDDTLLVDNNKEGIMKFLLIGFVTGMISFSAFSYEDVVVESVCDKEEVTVTSEEIQAMDRFFIYK
jgi:fluoride ion exporter CrcB/FEX